MISKSSIAVHCLEVISLTKFNYLKSPNDTIFQSDLIVKYCEYIKKSLFNNQEGVYKRGIG